MRPRLEYQPFKFSGCSWNNCNIVYKDNDELLFALVFTRALTGHPYNLHWPFTDFGQIREDSGRDAGNLLQLPR